jgi:glyoxylase I family protein
MTDRDRRTALLIEQGRDREAAAVALGRVPPSEHHPKENPMSDFPPLTHVALTVRDLTVSVPWYETLLDAPPVLDEDTDPDFHHTVYLLGNGTLLGLHQHGTAAPAGNFSEHRVGLDHVAFGCADRSELEKWAGRLDELGIEHGGIKDAPYGSGVSFRDPDGIALEFFAPPA